MSLTKGVSVTLMVLLVLVLTYDTVMHAKRNLPRKAGNNWAHITLFGLVILIILVMAEGRVL